MKRGEIPASLLPIISDLIGFENRKYLDAWNCVDIMMDVMIETIDNRQTLKRLIRYAANLKKRH